jgi:hypothetical protein
VDSDLTAFARLGDCAAPQEGVSCHFISADASQGFLQLELTTQVLQPDGSTVYLRDTLCNVDTSKVNIHRKKGRVTFDGKVPAADCSNLPGQPAHDVDAKLAWTGVTPLVVGINDCSVRATVEGKTPSQIFCAINITSGP